MPRRRCPLHRPVHRFGVVGVVAFRTVGVKLLVVLLVVGLLKQDVGADARLGEFPVVLHRGCGDVHVHAADSSVFVLDVVDGADALQNVFDGVERVLARFERQPFVPHVLQGDDFRFYLLLGELLAEHGLVLRMVGAVGAPVDAVVGEVERREHDDSVAVYPLLEPAGQCEHPFVEVGKVAFQQDGGFAVGDALRRFGLSSICSIRARLCLLARAYSIVATIFAVIDELFGYFGFLRRTSFLAFS